VRDTARRTEVRVEDDREKAPTQAPGGPAAKR